MISRLHTFLATAILFLIFFLPSSGFAMQGIAGTFLQPTKTMETWDSNKWDTLFDTYRKLGIREIIVQWVVFEENAGTTEEPQKPEALEEPSEPIQSVPTYNLSVISKIFEYAECNGMLVTLGGVFYNSYWERIKSEPELIQVHFMRIRKATMEAIKPIAQQLQSSPVFAGWYISQEIDDRTWLSEEYRSILCSFIKDTHGDLSTLVPNKPISISAFSNGWASPEKLGQFWRTVADESGIERVLFQDGVGVKKLGIKDVPIYLSIMQQKMQGSCCTIQPVLEIFTQLESDTFKAEPASLKRIHEQMREELPYAPHGVMIFSVAEYMSPLGGEKANALLQEVLYVK